MTDAAVPKTLYHYTTQEGLIGIVESHQLWMTRMQYLNDYRELQHAVWGMKEVIEHYSDNTRSESKFLTMLTDRFPKVDRLHFFAFSLSERADSLNLWRAYGGDRIGYAVGFDTANLVEKMTRQDFALHRCVYSADEQRDRLEGVLAESLKCLAREVDDGDRPLMGVDLSESQAYQVFLRGFAIAAMTFKNDAFADEKEWRMVSEPMGTYDRGKIRLRPGKSFSIPYYLFDLTNDSESTPCLVNNTVVGPCPDPDLARNALWDLFQPTGAVRCNNISLSSVPFRNW